MEHELVTLLWIVAAAALTPIIVGAFPRLPVPEVVWLLVLGVAIGPYGWGLAEETGSVALLSQLGLGLLFLVAGMEVTPSSLRSEEGARAVSAWTFSLVLALGITYAWSRVTDLEAWAACAIALTSTALGTLLPMLRDAGMHRGKMGQLVMVNGAVGEFGPIVAMSILLGGGSAWGALVSLAVFGTVAACLGFVLVKHVRRVQRLVDAVRHGAETTAQAPVRLVMALLVAMLALASAFGLDVILGAFLAGVILRMLLPEEPEPFLARLDGIAFGFLVPIFFVTSGMGIDIGVVLDNLRHVVVIFLAIVLVRGGPVWFAFRHLPRPEPAQLAIFASTGLPIIVAVTAVAVEAGQMTPTAQSIVVAAGALTVVVQPLLAFRLTGRTESELSPEPG